MELSDWLTPFVSAVAAFLGAISLRVLDTRRDARRDAREDKRLAMDRQREDSKDARDRRVEKYESLLAAIHNAVTGLQKWNSWVEENRDCLQGQEHVVAAVDSVRVEAESVRALAFRFQQSLDAVLPIASTTIVQGYGPISKGDLSRVTNGPMLGSRDFSQVRDSLSEGDDSDLFNVLRGAPMISTDEWVAYEILATEAAVNSLSQLRHHIRIELGYTDEPPFILGRP